MQHVDVCMPSAKHLGLHGAKSAVTHALRFCGFIGIKRGRSYLNSWVNPPRPWIVRFGVTGGLYLSGRKSPVPYSNFYDRRATELKLVLGMLAGFIGILFKQNADRSITQGITVDYVIQSVHLHWLSPYRTNKLQASEFVFKRLS